MKLKRERSRSVKYDDEKGYEPFIEESGQYSDINDMYKHRSNHRNNNNNLNLHPDGAGGQLFHSPSFSHSDMDQFSVDLASPAIAP